MSKARDLADSVSTGGILEDGAVSVSEISDLTVTAEELNNVAGVNSDVQTQLDLKAPLASPTFTGDATFDTNTLAVDSTNNRVGIGTSSPSVPLEVIHGSTSVGLLTRGSFNYQAKFESTDAEAAIVIEDNNSTNDGNRIGVITDDMTFITANSEAMRINNSGNVGIGTTSPTTGKVVINSTQTGTEKQLALRDSTNGWTRKIGVDTSNNLGFFDGDTERFRFGSSGELGIGGATYGTAGQVLTSGGSGAAPTWADAGGGGAQFDFTAEGSITAGDVVALTDTGKATVVSADAIGSLQSNPSTNNTSNANSHDIAACPRTGRMLLTLARSDGNGIEHIGVTESGGTLTFGSVTNIGGADAEGISVVPTGRVDGEFVSFYRTSSTRYLACRVFTVSSSRALTYSSQYIVMSESAITLDPGSAVLASPSNTSQPSIVVLHEFRDGSGYDEACVTGVQVSSSGTVSGSQQLTQLSGSGGTGANVSQDLFKTVYDSTNDRVIGGFRAQNGNAYLYAFSISGTTITQLGTTNFSAAQAIDIAYDGSLNYGVYIGGTASGTVEVDSFTFDGTNFSVTGTPTTVQTSGYDARTADITYDSGRKKFIIRAVKTGGSGYKHYITTGTVDSGGTINLTGSGAAAAIPFLSDPYIENTRHYGEYNPYNEITVLMHKEGSSHDVKLYTYSLGNEDKYLGVADTSATDGQTVTVNLKGSVDENQTGLAIGTIYYAGAAGALTTSGSTRVGKALSATALQITD